MCYYYYEIVECLKKIIAQMRLLKGIKFYCSETDARK